MGFDFTRFGRILRRATLRGTLVAVLIAASGCLPTGYNKHSWENVISPQADAAPYTLGRPYPWSPEVKGKNKVDLVKVNAPPAPPAPPAAAVVPDVPGAAPSEPDFQAVLDKARQTPAPAVVQAVTVETVQVAQYNGDGGIYAPRPAFAPVVPMAAASPAKVAILLPLSGEKSALGEALLQSAQMALFDMGAQGIELMPRDTAGSPSGAVKAMRSAIDDGAQLVLGPLFSDEVAATKAIASQSNINMIVFSTDWTQAGGNTFVMGFLPFNQVMRIVDYAAEHGLRRVGVLAPNTDYGNAVVSTYAGYASQRGINTVDIVRVAGGSSDISAIVRNFSRFDDRAELMNQKTRPLQARLQANPNDLAAKAELAQMNASAGTGQAPFDAVLLPFGGEQAKTVAGLLSTYNAGPDTVRRLGTGLWDDPALASNKDLQGALFAAPAPQSRAAFERRYAESYGQNPPRLATLAYDATALAVVLAQRGMQYGSRPAFDQSAIGNPNGFAGLDGIFRFRADGMAERGLAVLEIRDGAIRVIDPAPTTFQGWGR